MPYAVPEAACGGVPPGGGVVPVGAGAALGAGGAEFVTYWNRAALNGSVDYTLEGPSAEVWRALSTS